MVYTTALDKFTALTQRATAEAVAAAPAGPTESIPELSGGAYRVMAVGAGLTATLTLFEVCGDAPSSTDSSSESMSR